MKRRANKKSAKRSNSPAKKAPVAPAVDAPSPKAEAASRRKFLRYARDFGLIAVGVGAVGWYLVDDAMTTQLENDMSRIGNGIPTIVQIHDPQCPTCTALQREARKALSDFGPNELQFVVANLRTAEGREYANRYGVEKVTLLFMDGEGKRRNTLVGPYSSTALEEAFRRHVKAYGSSKS